VNSDPFANILLTIKRRLRSSFFAKYFSIIADLPYFIGLCGFVGEIIPAKIFSILKNFFFFV
jgi:hypothetical protein